MRKWLVALIAILVPITAMILLLRSPSAVHVVLTITRDSSSVGNILTNLGLALFKLLIVIIASFVVLALGTIGLVRLIQAIEQSGVVLDDLHNSTGVTDLDQVIPGLTQLARDEFRQSLRWVYRVLKEQKRDLIPEGYPLADIDLALGIWQSTLDQLEKQIWATAPIGYAWAMPLIRAVLPRRGSWVSGYLQQRDTDSGGLGITFEITSFSSLGTSAKATILPMWHRKAKSRETRGRLQPSHLTETKTLDSADNAGTSILLTVDTASQPESSGAAPFRRDVARAVQNDIEVSTLSLTEGYIRMLTPAFRWLAIWMFGQALESHSRAAPNTWEKLQRAVLRKPAANDVDRRATDAQRRHSLGVLFSACAQASQSSGDPDMAEPLCDRAISEFEQAVSGFPKHERYRVYKNLGLAYILKGRLQQDLAECAELQYRAEGNFEAALEDLPTKLNPYITADIRILLCVAWLLRGVAEDNKKLIIHASRKMQRMEPRWADLDAASSDSQEVQRSARLAADALYNAASWYALAYEVQPKQTEWRDHAIRLLAYSLARDPVHRAWAARDPDLQCIRGIVSHLERQLRWKQTQEPGLSHLSGPEFVANVESILRALKNDSA